jgi:hypothetical protein
MTNYKQILNNNTQIQNPLLLTPYRSGPLTFIPVNSKTKKNSFSNSEFVWVIGGWNLRFVCYLVLGIFLRLRKQINNSVTR